MARYTRASGEACNMAVRIKRQHQKRQGSVLWVSRLARLVSCFKLNNGDDLKDHLLSGLSAVGVPKVLKDTAFPFNYNKIEELIAIIKDHDIGCVIMEPQRSDPPR